VLFVQCFVFGDGGVFALGANVFNMALLSSLVGFCCYRLSCGASPSPTRRVAALAFASWCATMCAAASCAEQLALSDTARSSLLLPAMLGVHALVGVGEAVISAIVLAAVLRLRPELLEPAHVTDAPASSARAFTGYGLGLSLSVVLLLVPLSCESPDGLSSVAQSLGFQSAERLELAAPLAEYGVPGFASGVLSTVLAGVVGVLLLFGSCWLLALCLVPRAGKASSAQVAVESSG